MALVVEEEDFFEEAVIAVEELDLDIVGCRCCF